MLTKYSRPKCQCIIVLFSKPTKYSKTLWKTIQHNSKQVLPLSLVPVPNSNIDGTYDLHGSRGQSTGPTVIFKELLLASILISF